MMSDNIARRRRVVPVVRAGGWTHRRTDMTKLIAVCLHFANVPKREVSVSLSVTAKTHKEIDTRY